MKRLLKITRTTPALSAASAASIPSDSGSTASNNSRGASVTAAELSTVLNTTLDQINLDDDESDVPLKDMLHQLDQEASKYENSKINEDDYAKWKCSTDTAHLLSIACKCAVGSYHPAGDLLSTPNYTFKSQHSISPSAGGSIKASMFTVVEPTHAQDSTDEDDLLHVLVVSIRGSASKVDHMVNANQESKDTGDFFGPGLSSSSIKAHSGFLNSAKQLEESVMRRIRNYTNGRQQTRSHIMFTGHSAGGAVASLLFLRLLHQLQAEPILFSCITFGSPPSLTASINLTSTTHAGNVGDVINVINECDLVCRADRPYILSLVQLLSSIYARNIQSPTSPDDSVSEPGSSVESEKPLLYAPGRVWPLPPSQYHHIGDKIVLFTRLDSDMIKLRAVKVSDLEFEKLLFCRLTVHRKTCYMDRTSMIEEGKFNK